MGEKYDGIRCCWNPDVGELYPKKQKKKKKNIVEIFESTRYTRAGRELPFLEQAADRMPPIYLDGEVWYPLLCSFYLFL